MRYATRKLVRNGAEDYSHEEVSEYKDRTPIDHYTTPIMRYPSIEDHQDMNVATETWKLGDRLYKYAERYYGSGKYWWIIAWYNNKPTENHFENGDVVYVPTPLTEVLGFLGY